MHVYETVLFTINLLRTRLSPYRFTIQPQNTHREHSSKELMFSFHNEHSLNKYCSSLENSQPFPCIVYEDSLHTQLRRRSYTETNPRKDKLSSVYISLGGQGHVSYCRFTMTFRSYFFGPCAKRRPCNVNSRASIAQDFQTSSFLACFLRFYSTIRRHEMINLLEISC